jgi:hypothetical protein
VVSNTGEVNSVTNAPSSGSEGGMPESLLDGEVTQGAPIASEGQTQQTEQTIPDAEQQASNPLRPRWRRWMSRSVCWKRMRWWIRIWRC